MSRTKNILITMVICTICFVFAINIHLSWADGVIVGSGGHIISEPGQKALVIWDKDIKKEILILSASFGIESLSNFCWIIPIRSSEDPNVRASDIEIFDVLEDLFPVYTRWDWYGTYQNRNTFSYGGSNIEVINIQKIGVYDLATIWADDPNDLTDWLVDNGYNVPAGFAGKIKTYTDATEGCYFVANKINLENEFSSPLARLETYSPGIYAYLMADDLDLSKISDVIDDLRTALVKDIMDGKAYDPNSFAAYIMDQSEYEGLLDEWSNSEISYGTLRNRVNTYLTTSSLFETIIDLFEGAGTPIEITFYPDKPTYPLYISSLASNYGGIDVYFIGPYKVEDDNNILIHWKSTELSSSTTSELEDIGDIDIPDSCHYVSLLIFRGYMDSLDEDAVFVEYRGASIVPPPIPPYYYPPYYPPYTFPSSIYRPPIFPSYNPPHTININIGFPFPFGGFSGSLFGSGYYAGSGYFGGGYYAGSGYFGGGYYAGSGYFGGGYFGGLYGGSYYGGRPYGSSYFGSGYYGSPYSSSYFGGLYTGLRYPGGGYYAGSFSGI